MTVRSHIARQGLLIIAFIVTGIVITASVAVGQIRAGADPLPTLAELHGTWFNGQFIEELSASRSLSRAFAGLGTREPLWLRIDSSKGSDRILVGRGLTSIDTMVLAQMDVRGVGRKWVLGLVEQPTWVLTHDALKRSYVALTPLDSLARAPIVLGALPSKNPDPMFILRRMVNASLLSGSWKTPKGQKYIFSNDLTASIDGQRVTYQLSFEGNGPLVRLSTTQGQPHTWTVERNGTTLTLMPKSGSAVVLSPEK
jgi:hypothetical protein